MERPALLFIRWGIRLGGIFLYLFGTFPEIFFRKWAFQDQLGQLLISILGIIIFIATMIHFPGISIQTIRKITISIFSKLSKKNLGIVLIGIGCILIGILSWIDLVCVSEILQVIPYPVNDLSVKQIQGNWFKVPVVSITADRDAGNKAIYITDGNLDTYWGGSQSYHQEEQTIIIDLGNVVSVGRISWSGRADKLDLSPDEYILSISTNGDEWTTISQGKATIGAAINRNEVTLAPRDGRYLKIIFPMRHEGILQYNLYISELEVYRFDSKSNNSAPVVLLEWSDPNGGFFSRASTRYLIHYSNISINNENRWETANPISGTPLLNNPGQKETAIFELPKSLEGEIIHCSIRTISKNSILSRFSNSTKIKIKEPK